MGLPVAALLTRLLARHRTRRGHPAPIRTAVADILIPAGTLPWLWMILTPQPGPGGVSLLPFHDLAALAGVAPRTAFVQVGGNLLVFAALGALLPARSARFAGLAPVALTAAGGSLLVELLQYGLRLGRVASVDDLLLNTAGAALAAAVSRPWWAPRIPARIGP
ncbi:VanZ family protein [Streptosporangium sp. KLBMP 9127]|nr:VanZ family protein [Streptosporangium sp. KLBMP 9127]